MGKIEIEDFAEKNISRIFMAAKIREAELVEKILTEEGIDYAIELEPYLQAGFVVVSELNGAAFYVLSGQGQYCRNLLASRGLSSGLVVEDS